MKKTVAVVVLLVSCWLVASAGLAFCKGGREAEVTINVHWPNPPDSPIPVITVGQKDFDPIPCVYRKGKIEVSVAFTGNVPNGQELILSGFRALVHVQPQGREENPGGSWISDFDEPGKLEIKEESGTPPTWSPVTNLVFDAGTGSRTIKLDGLRGPGGPRRLISYKLEMAGSGTGNPKPINVVFDPPWGERP